ncbi:hypothetical protein M413DRAFT_79136, partial [Hebeloma cylindrosporum]
PLTIISARLKGMPFLGSVPALIYHHLYTYLLGNLALVDFEFSLESQDDHAMLNSSLLEMTADFRNGRFLVILTDHSSPDTGDVHIAPNNAGATTLEEVIIILQPAKCIHYSFLRRRRRSSRARKVSSLYITDLSPRFSRLIFEIPSNSRALFHQIIAFAQKNLQLAFTNKFLCDYAQNLFIHDKVHMGATIFDHQTLGAHTDVILFKAGEHLRFFWAHPILRPHGNPASTICHSCQFFMPWIDPNAKKRKLGQIKDHRAQIVHKCQNCELTLRYTFPEGAKWVRNNGYDGTERGSWLCELLE